MKLFSLLVFYFFKNCLCDRLYEFTPENNKLSLNEGDKISIYFEELRNNATDFDHCYYNSKTFSGDYEIIKITQFSNDFSEDGRLKRCGIALENIDDKAPLEWTLTAHDAKSKKNFSETVTADFYYNIKPFTETSDVLQGATFFNYLQTQDINLVKCVLNIGDNEIELDIKSPSTANIDGARLTSLGRQKCGFKISNATLNDTQDVYLIASDDLNKNYRAKIGIRVFEIDSDYTKNQTIEAELGDTVTFECGLRTGSETNGGTQQYCILFNPQGEFVFEDTLCVYSLPTLRIEDIGVWSCWISYKFSMEHMFCTTEIREIRKSAVEIFAEENVDDDIFVLGCALKNAKKLQAEFCRFSKPDGYYVKTYKGAASERYTSLTTDLDNGICGIEIQLPLLEGEKGTWKCEIHFNKDLLDDSAGAFIQIGPSPKSSLKKNSPPLIVNLSQSFTISCQVPYASDHCFIAAPNGTLYQAKYPLKSTLGECKLNVANAEFSDNGTWTCFFARENGIPDDEVYVEVSIVESKISYADVEVIKGGRVELVCNTGGVALDYCRFVSPKHTIYSLRLGESKTNETGYFGKGLEYGDCGIEIYKVDESHAGKWVCRIGLTKKDLDLEREMSLNLISRGLSGAESVGLSVGVVTAAVCVLGLIGYRFYVKRKRTADNSASAENVSEDALSNGSGENIILETRHINYNTNI